MIHRLVSEFKKQENTFTQNEIQILISEYQKYGGNGTTEVSETDWNLIRDEIFEKTGIQKSVSVYQSKLGSLLNKLGNKSIEDGAGAAGTTSTNTEFQQDWEPEPDDPITTNYLEPENSTRAQNSRCLLCSVEIDSETSYNINEDFSWNLCKLLKLNDGSFNFGFHLLGCQLCFQCKEKTESGLELIQQLIYIQEQISAISEELEGTIAKGFYSHGNVYEEVNAKSFAVQAEIVKHLRLKEIIENSTPSAPTSAPLNLTSTVPIKEETIESDSHSSALIDMNNSQDFSDCNNDESGEEETFIDNSEDETLNRTRPSKRRRFTKAEHDALLAVTKKYSEELDTINTMNLTKRREIYENIQNAINSAGNGNITIARCKNEIKKLKQKKLKSYLGNNKSSK